MDFFLLYLIYIYIYIYTYTLKKFNLLSIVLFTIFKVNEPVKILYGTMKKILEI